MITVEVESSAVRLKLDAIPENIRQKVKTTVGVLAEKLRSHIAQDKLRGQVLNRRTGHLGDSLFYKVEDTAQGITGTVATGKEIKYAAIHEFGGTIHHPGGTPYLITKDYGALFISKKVAEEHGGNWPVTAAHDIHMPERSYMRTGLADMREEIVTSLRDAVMKAAQI